MQSTYNSNGVRFRYPSHWELSEQREGEQISITVSSPETAFWTVSLFRDCPEPDDIVAAVLDAFREEYAEMDEYPSRVRVCRRPTVGRDIDFVCLELLNTACVRAFRAREFTVLVLFQLTEGEQEVSGPVLDRITRSLSLSA
jgi:hypothetical protein